MFYLNIIFLQQKLSVLFLCGWYPSRVLPTNGDFIQRHAEAVALKHQVTIMHIVTDKNLIKNLEIKSDVINGVKTHIAYIKETKNTFQKLFLFISAFRSLLKKTPYFDIVHLNEIYPFGIFSLYIKWFQKKPYIITEHWTGYHIPNSKFISKFQKSISKVITKNASFICPVSDDLAKSMKLFGLKGNYKKVPNVVDTELFYPSKASPDTFTIIHISNMNDDHKNIKGLLNVIASIQKEIKDFQFQFIGENSNKYVDFSNKIGIDKSVITFVDQIPHKEIANKIKESSLFILFSNYENLPCVILEAFSCGVPVISTDVGGIKEYFPHNFGKLIEINNRKELKAEIINFYKKKYLVASKNKMHNYVKSTFSKKVIAQNFTELYFKSLNL